MKTESEKLPRWLVLLLGKAVIFNDPAKALRYYKTLCRAIRPPTAAAGIEIHELSGEGAYVRIVRDDSGVVDVRACPSYLRVAEEGAQAIAEGLRVEILRAGEMPDEDPLDDSDE